MPRFLLVDQIGYIQGIADIHDIPKLDPLHSLQQISDEIIIVDNQVEQPISNMIVQNLHVIAAGEIFGFPRLRRDVANINLKPLLARTAEVISGTSKLGKMLV